MELDQSNNELSKRNWHSKFRIVLKRHFAVEQWLFLTRNLTERHIFLFFCRTYHFSFSMLYGMQHNARIKIPSTFARVFFFKS